MHRRTILEYFHYQLHIEDKPVRGVVPQSYLNWYRSAAHGPLHKLNVMQNDKKTKPSSGSKGANKTDLHKDEEVRFTTDQIHEIELDADNLGAEIEEALKRFPEGSVFICERVRREPCMTLHALRALQREFSASDIRDRMIYMLWDMLSCGRGLDDGDLTISKEDWNLWHMLYQVIDTLYDAPIPISDLRATELVPIVCLQ